MHTLLGYSDEEHAEFTREMEARDLARANSPPEPLSPRFVGLVQGREAHKAAVQAWEQECARLEVEFGVTAAEERASDFGKKASAILDRIAATRATTIAGLKIKARLAGDSDELPIRSPTIFSRWEGRMPNRRRQRAREGRLRPPFRFAAYVAGVWRVSLTSPQ